jgi:membrane protein DedA with SNARE-associated domain
MQSWIETYGLWAVLFGAFIEGETVFIAAGYAISQGYLAPGSAFLFAMIGGSLSDCTYFFLGRRYGARLMRRFSLLRRLRARATLLLRRWGRAAAFAVRFATGMRLALPIMIGSARFPIPLFVGFNLLGSAAFAALYLTLGFFFGEALGHVLERMRGREGWILLGIALLGVVVWTLRERRLLGAASETGAEPRTRR